MYAFEPCSEAAISAIEARPNSPEWLQEEVSRTRKGLMRLRQNVVLLRNGDEPDSFFPVCCLYAVSKQAAKCPGLAPMLSPALLLSTA
jgi:hypothetical protein